ncbi:hypothetical protein F2Q69_00035237 [Brassica cretica]|uniref:Uncharacterized protein n=1 Tax=Brassica cretica TaxID=69181 RepID=A0A8S9STI0_BRACR|nr:hypothetical protein F2Q69_00035237 [Brassica cretica]
MSSFRMIFQPLSLLFVTLFFASLCSGRFVYEFDPVPSSATTPLETDSGGAVIEVVAAVRGIHIPLAPCNGTSLPLGNCVLQ